jgi:hypothetical protein
MKAESEERGAESGERRAGSGKWRAECSRLSNMENKEANTKKGHLKKCPLTNKNKNMFKAG